MITVFHQESKVSSPTVLDLSFHGFSDSRSKMTKEQLFASIKQPPSGTIEINLAANKLGKCSLEFLLDLLNNIQPQINTLNLKLNGFHELDYNALLQFFHHIPHTVKHIDFSSNKLDKYSIDQLAALLITIQHETTIDMSYNMPNDRTAVESLRYRMIELGRDNINIIDENENLTKDGSESSSLTLR